MMQQQLGWYFPDGETHLVEWMTRVNQKRDGRLQYQLAKYDAALKYVRRRRLAVDVGAHIGQWSRNMAADFDAVEAFEPVPDYAACWRANVTDRPNARLHELALGDQAQTVCLRCGTPGSHGDTFVAPKDQANVVAVDVPMRTLDSFDLADVDFVKIDCEGYELFVLRGAEQTIKRCRPCVIVEQKPGKALNYGLGETDAVALLRSWGAKVRSVLSGDYLLSWDAA
jgi:FkbM family methyltransferase